MMNHDESNKILGETCLRPKLHHVTLTCFDMFPGQTMGKTPGTEPPGATALWRRPGRGGLYRLLGEAQKAAGMSRRRKGDSAAPLDVVELKTKWV